MTDPQNPSNETSRREIRDNLNRQDKMSCKDASEKDIKILAGNFNHIEALYLKIKCNCGIILTFYRLVDTCQRKNQNN